MPSLERGDQMMLRERKDCPTQAMLRTVYDSTLDTRLIKLHIKECETCQAALRQIHPPTEVFEEWDFPYTEQQEFIKDKHLVDCDDCRTQSRQFRVKRIKERPASEEREIDPCNGLERMIGFWAEWSGLGEESADFVEHVGACPFCRQIVSQFCPSVKLVEAHIMKTTAGPVTDLLEWHFMVCPSCEKRAGCHGTDMPEMDFHKPAASPEKISTSMRPILEADAQPQCWPKTDTELYSLEEEEQLRRQKKQ